MLDVRLARLGLPLPLEPAIGRALMHRERAAQHEGLVLAWELAIRILAGSLWAACRHAGASSTALERIATKLDRPSMGHWVELARTCASILRETNHPAAAAFRTTLDGLESSLPAECGLRALSQRIAELPDAPPRPRRVQEALDQLPHYRNCAQSTHKDIGSAFREASVEPLLEGLVDFCERVPLLGAFSLVLVGRLESRARGGSAELARLHGTFPSWNQREIPESVWPSLVSSRPYLFLEPDLAVPLFPMAAVTSSGAEWHVGWYARQVHVPTVAYQGAGGHEFQIVLAPDEIESLVRGAKSGSESATNAAALQLEPYRGLLAYDEEHAAIFFGREEETEAALARIEELGALFVFGASGSGKSSWMRAGIVPALRARAALAGRRLLPIVLVPGDRPLAALRRALTLARGGSPEEAAAWARAVDEAIPPTPSAANPSKSSASSERGLAHLLRGLASQGSLPALVVDQMEEAATLALDRDEGRAFLALVASAAASAKDVGAVVLASARADLLAPLLEHESVRQFLEVNGAPVGSIPPERLARVIVEPLRGRKVPLEAGLAETILADVANEPGSLALLSQVLTTVWSERARFGGALTKQGYVDAGRVSGALEKQAEAALSEACVAASAQSTSSDIEKRVDRLFRALAASDAGERFTRRRVRLEALASELGNSTDEIRALVQPFVTRRLVVLATQGNEETIEVAHERLLVAWPRLANLLALEREVLELRAEIEIASGAWQASGGRRELWSDETSKLRRGEELLASGRLDVDVHGRNFLVASRTAARHRKRVERVVLAAVILLAIAAGYGMWSARQSAGREVQAKDAALEAKNAALVLAREAQMRGLISALEYFDSLDDDVYIYARKQARPASQWWIEDAKRLLDGEPEDPATRRAWKPGLRDVDEELAKLRARARERTPSGVESESIDELAWIFDDNADEWWHRECLKLQAGRQRIEKQIEYAEASVRTAHALNEWRMAIEAIARSDRYQGVKWPSGDRLTPQVGLVPIGPDPVSGLWEFAHLATGRQDPLFASRRRAQLGLALRDTEQDPEMGLVLVLLPGGRVPVANSEDQGQDHSLTEIDLDPFFLSKFEMTAAQWERIGGARTNDRERTLGTLPASGLSWDDCQVVLPHVGWLRLPTEAQWEYGCRARTVTKWWPGDEEQGLHDAAQLRFGEGVRGSSRVVGLELPNPFGLHDVHGNVWEWCGDALDVDGTRRAGDGLRDVAGADFRVYRGGDYWGGAENARSSARNGATPDFRNDDNGLRPARGIAP